MRARAVAVAGLAALTLAGCSSGAERDEGAPSSRGGTRTASPTRTAQAEAIGPRIAKTQTLAVEGYEVDITVYALRQPLGSQDRPDRGGYVFAGVDVRTCVRTTPSGPAQISANPWSLAYADATAIKSSFASPESFTVPLYPQDDKSVPAGDCVRGWVVFEVPKGKRPTLAVYTPTNTELPTQPLRWPLAG